MTARRASRAGRNRSGSARDGATDPRPTGHESRDGATRGVPALPNEQELLDPHERARQICLRLLTSRPRTRAELAATLRRKGIDAPTAQAVLDRLAEVNLVDDAALAESYVHSGHAYQGLGRRALTAHLRRRGVDEATTSTAVSTVDSAAEEQRARELVRRRLPAMTADEATAIRRLVGLLARKGYPEGLSYRVVREELRRAGRDTTLLDDAPLD